MGIKVLLGIRQNIPSGTASLILDISLNWTYQAEPNEANNMGKAEAETGCCDLTLAKHQTPTKVTHPPLPRLGRGGKKLNEGSMS